jgi:hypothetical protein
LPDIDFAVGIGDLVDSRHDLRTFSVEMQRRLTFR